MTLIYLIFIFQMVVFRLIINSINKEKQKKKQKQHWLFVENHLRRGPLLRWLSPTTNVEMQPFKDGSNLQTVFEAITF